MEAKACLVVHVSSLSGHHKNIGSFKGHIYSPSLPALSAHLPALGVPTTSPLSLLKWIHGQSSANRSKPGPSFQL
jgi:hypothetical protein